MTRLRAAWDRLRSSYWAVPSSMAVGAMMLAVGMIRLDELSRLPDELWWAYTGGPEGARAVLSTIAGSMITVAGTTFSITIVTLTLASQQFGPRLLRNFLRDLGNQVVLGTFLSTFIYCLLVLRTVRGLEENEFVPHLSVTIGVALAILSLGVLIFFIHHVATSIQASAVIANVARDLNAAIRRLFPDSIGEDAASAGEAGMPQVAPASSGSARAVTSMVTGYVQAIDADRLIDIAREHDVVVAVEAGPGAFVLTGGVLLRMVSDAPEASNLDAALHKVFIIGDERTGTQDVMFFVGQLVELAVRALSPGINDPGTARLCIDRLEQALAHLATRRIPSAARRDSRGRIRVYAPPASFPEIATTALEEIARHARASVLVTCRLLDAAGRLAASARREPDREALRRAAEAIASGLKFADVSDRDRHLIERAHRAAVVALHP